jgi:hypothetical protein
LIVRMPEGIVLPIAFSTMSRYVPRQARLRYAVPSRETNLCVVGRSCHGYDVITIFPPAVGLPEKGELKWRLLRGLDRDIHKFNS